jgi:hypothetical protein
MQLNDVTQFVLDVLSSRTDVMSDIKHGLDNVPSTHGRVRWLQQYFGVARTCGRLSDLQAKLDQRGLRLDHVTWSALVGAIVPKSPMEAFLDQILAGDVTVRRAYTIERYEIVPKGEAESWPAVHAFVSIDTQDGTVYGDKQTYIESTHGGEIFDLEDPELWPDREKLFDRLEELCRAHERTRT